MELKPLILRAGNGGQAKSREICELTDDVTLEDFAPRIAPRGTWTSVRNASTRETAAHRETTDDE